MFVFTVGSPFRLRVSQYLGHAPFPLPARQTGRADFPHPAFVQNESRLRPRIATLDRTQLEQAQLFVQMLVGEP